MKIIINKYIALNFFKYFVGVLVAICFVIFIFDFLELTRLTSGKGVGVSTIILMSLQRVVIYLQRLLGIVILIASVLTFSNFAKSSEIVIFRSIGLPSWQFIAPAAAMALILGLLYVGIFNPITSRITSSYKKMESQYIKNNSSNMSLSKTGLWIMQVDKTYTTSVLHAKRVSPATQEVFEVTFYLLNESGDFSGRIDSESALLREGYWEIKNAYVSDEKKLSAFQESYILPTSITFDRIQDSLIPPESLSFWQLQSFINIAENSGLSVVRHKVYFQKLLMIPLFFISMVFLGAVFSLSPARFIKNYKKYGLVMLTGFAMFFLGDVFSALAMSGSIPISLAMITPTIIALMIAVFFMLYYEEGRV